MIEIAEFGPGLGEDDLQRLESTIRAKLPKPYRAFLQAHNGGRPNPDAIDIPDCYTTDVQLFYGILPESDACDIFWVFETLEGCKENQLLPFATDSCGSEFVIVVAEEDYGHVYYFDSREDPPKPYFIAKDFDEFLSKIRELTPEELAEIEELAKYSSSTDSASTEPVDVSFPFTGSRPADAALANSAAGYETTPRGYVWHRHQDGETLQLVPKDVHKQTGDPAGYGLRWRSS